MPSIRTVSFSLSAISLAFACATAVPIGLTSIPAAAQTSPAGDSTASSTTAPRSSAWFRRWGMDPAKSFLSWEEQWRVSDVSSRLQEAIAAAQDGDAVANQLVALELHHRCEGDFFSKTKGPIRLQDCGELARWMLGSVKRVDSKTLDMEFPHRYADISAWSSEVTPLPRALEIAKALEAAYDMEPARFLYYLIAVYRGRERRDAVAAEAHYRLAHMFKNGLGGPAWPDKAAEHHQRAAEIGHAVASYTVAFDYLKKAAEAKTKKGADGYTSIAGRYFRRAADAGVVDAAFRYAHMLENNQVGEPDGPRLVFVYYRKAALQGHLASFSGVARAYENGWGVPVSQDQAIEWRSRAARAGDPEAAWLLAGHYQQQRDFSRAMPYLEQAAKGGYPGASDLLANWRRARVTGPTFMDRFLDVVSFVADVGQRMEQQRREEMAVQAAAWSGYRNIGPDGPLHSSGSAAVGGGSSTDTATMSSSSGAKGAATGGQRLSDRGSGDGSRTNGDRNGGGSERNGGGNERDGSGFSSSDNADAGGSKSSSGGKAGAAGGKGSDLFLTVEKDTSAERHAALMAKGEAEARRQEQQRAADAKRLAAQHDAEHKRARAEEDARSQRRLIACHGSLEAARNARVSCQ